MRNHNRPRGSTSRSTIGALLAGAIVVPLLVGAGLSQATARGSVTSGNSTAETTTVACNRLWFNDHTAADEDRCRDKGWTVRWWAILSPDSDRMWTGVGPCPTEDSRHCYWNARVRGNHRGMSFVQLGHLGTFRNLVRINGRNALANDQANDQADDQVQVTGVAITCHGGKAYVDITADGYGDVWYRTREHWHWLNIGGDVFTAQGHTVHRIVFQRSGSVTAWNDQDPLITGHPRERLADAHVADCTR